MGVEAFGVEGRGGGGKGRVGLHNIYHRLVTYYGKENVQFSFSSIPYYRNEILISIPLTTEEEGSTKNHLQIKICK